MPKRFTDTEKWADPWFSELEQCDQILWLYMLDSCDHSGVYKHSPKLAQFHIGKKVSVGDLCGVYGERLVKLNDELVFIPKFLKFQYDKGLNSNKPVIKSARKMLESRGLLVMVNELFGNDYLTITEPLGNDSVTIKEPLDNDSTIIKDKSKDKSKDKDKDKRKSKETEFPEVLNTDEFKALWTEWVKYRKVIKKPMPITTISRQLKKLESMGVEKAMLALNTAMEKGWQGFHEPDGNTVGFGGKKQPLAVAPRTERQGYI